MWVLSTAEHKDHYRVQEKLHVLSTPWCSRAVPQPSTDLALHRFAAEFGWDPAFSMQYGRQLRSDVVPVTSLPVLSGVKQPT